jgi:hypothetical protein
MHIYHRSRPHSLRDATCTFWPQIPTVRRGARGLGLPTPRERQPTLGLRLIPLKRGLAPPESCPLPSAVEVSRSCRLRGRGGAPAARGCPGHLREGLGCPSRPRPDRSRPGALSCQGASGAAGGATGQLSGGASPRLSGMSLLPLGVGRVRGRPAGRLGFEAKMYELRPLSASPRPSELRRMHITRTWLGCTRLWPPHK